jgi:hypothetical protein
MILRVNGPDSSGIPGWHVGNVSGTWRMANPKIC